MKIPTKNYTVEVDTAAYYGWFEHNELGYESGGGLWFGDNKVLIDYDGVFELPTEVIMVLHANGFDITYCLPEIEDDGAECDGELPTIERAV